MSTTRVSCLLTKLALKGSLSCAQFTPVKSINRWQGWCCHRLRDLLLQGLNWELYGDYLQWKKGQFYWKLLTGLLHKSRNFLTFGDCTNLHIVTMVQHVHTQWNSWREDAGLLRHEVLKQEPAIGSKTTSTVPKGVRRPLIQCKQAERLSCSRTCCSTW